MKSHTAYMTFETRERRELIRITEEVQAAVDEAGIAEGMVLVSAMHITAGVWVNDDEPGLHEDMLEWLDKIAPPSWAPAADEVAARAAPRRRRLPPPPRRRGQRRRPPQEPARPPPGDRPGDRRPARPRPLAAGLLLRVRRRPPEAAGDQGDGGVRGGRHPEWRGRRRRSAACCASRASPADTSARRSTRTCSAAPPTTTRRGGPTCGVLDGHEDDPKDSALALRLMGAVHRLVLEGGRRSWRGATRPADGDGERTWEAFRAALEERVDELRPLSSNPVQTNEVGRCAALLPGFLDVAARTGRPLRMLEVGASAGLNLRLERVPLRGGGLRLGPAGLADADRVRARAAAGSRRSRRRSPSGRAATPRRSTPAARRAG